MGRLEENLNNMSVANALFTSHMQTLILALKMYQSKAEVANVMGNAKAIMIQRFGRALANEVDDRVRVAYLEAIQEKKKQQKGIING